MERDLERYLLSHSGGGDPLLDELERDTHLSVVQPRMLSGALQGKFLAMLSGIVSPQYILEIGTFTGYSAICLARGLREKGELHTIEINDELGSLSSRYFDRAAPALNGRIIAHTGSALDIAPGLGLCFDLVFIDGDKREYPAYYRMLFECKLVRSGSVIVADNTIWYGKVCSAPPENDLYTRGVMEFNDTVQADPRVEKVIVPLRDGLSIIKVK